MILYKTWQGQKVSVLRDACPTDVGYDNSAGVYQQLVEDQTGHVFLVNKMDLYNHPDQQWPTVGAPAVTPEHWP